MNNGDFRQNSGEGGEFSHIFAEGTGGYGQAPFAPPPPKRVKYAGLAIASLVLGIIAFVMAAFVNDPITAVVLAPGAVIFFAVFTAINRKMDAKALVGGACGIAAILVSVALFILSALHIYDYKSMYNGDFFKDYFGDGYSESEETQEEPDDEDGVFM